MFNTTTGYSKPSINIGYCSYLNYDHLRTLNSPTLSPENLKLTGFTLRTSPLPLPVSNTSHPARRSSEGGDRASAFHWPPAPPRSANAAGRVGILEFKKRKHLVQMTSITCMNTHPHPSPLLQEQTDQGSGQPDSNAQTGAALNVHPNALP